MKKINIIAACDINGAIGYKNKLLWKLPQDLKHFKALTEGSTVIMGTNTFISIGNALPNRENIVLSRNPENYGELFNDENIIICDDLESAVETASNEKIFIIGGSSLYSRVLNDYKDYIDMIYLTKVNVAYEKFDSTFPLEALKSFKMISKFNIIDNNLPITFITYSSN